MSGYLRTKGLFMLVSGKEPRPVAPVTTTSPGGTTSAIDPVIAKEQRDWDHLCDKAVGELLLGVECKERIHFSGIDEDPVAMWRKLEAVHAGKKASSRFAAMDALMSIRKLEDETLPQLSNRIDEALAHFTSLIIPTATVADLTNEFGAIVMIKALPQEQFAPLLSSISLTEDLTREKLKTAFLAHETHRFASSSSSSTPVALMSSTPSPNSSSTLKCEFCGIPNHSQARCFKYQNAQRHVQEDIKSGGNRRQPNRGSYKGKQAANVASEGKETPGPSPSITEFAGNASLSDSPSEPKSKMDDKTDNASSCLIDACKIDGTISPGKNTSPSRFTLDSGGKAEPG